MTPAEAIKTLHRAGQQPPHVPITWDLDYQNGHLVLTIQTDEGPYRWTMAPERGRR